MRGFVFQAILDELIIAQKMADEYGHFHQLSELQHQVLSFLESSLAGPNEKYARYFFDEVQVRAN